LREPNYLAITTAISLAAHNRKNLINIFSQGQANRDMIPHRLFDVIPDKSRQLDSATFVPKSNWILNLLCQAHDEGEAQKSWELYSQVKVVKDFAPAAGLMWERAFHIYVGRVTGRTFRLQDLDMSSNAPTVDLAFGPRIASYQFGTPALFQNHLEEHVGAQTPCYLYPTQSTFEGIDSVLYVPNHPLMCFQITRAAKHDISIKGLQTIQSWLNPATSLRATLRPDKQAWRLIFLLPSTTALVFDRVQKLAGDTAQSAWVKKTRQYKLSLEASAVWLGLSFEAPVTIISPDLP
jgi:hypothetical protein